MAAVLLRGGELTPEQVAAVAYEHAPVEIDPAAWEKVERGYRALLAVEEKDGPVPLWKLADLSDDEARGQVSDLPETARRVIVDHAAAIGSPMPTALVRAAMLVRLDTLIQGYSGVRPETVRALAAMLNAGVHPLVPGKGHLSMAGDLAPLAHIALVLCAGGGEVEGDTGFAVLGRHEDKVEVLTGAEAMRRANIERLWPTLKESFSLIVGTSMAAARAALIAWETERLFKLAIAAGALTCEAMRANRSAFDERIHRLGPGRADVLAVARQLERWTAGSQLVGCRKGGDAFSIRCLPQILGGIQTALRQACQVINEELRLVSDNPLILDDENGPACVDGGNFHGERLALALDSLRLGLAEIGALSERHAFIMTNRARSGGLPSFLVRERGLNSGFMLAQYTAAALASENKSLAMPYATDSLPACQDYEDHGGLASLSAAATEKVLANVRAILAIEILCAAQGVDIRADDGAAPGELSDRLRHTLRRQVDHWVNDSVMYRLIDAATRMCRPGGELDEVVQDVMEMIDG
ncbi:MAG TPA: aromatic amino acid lyase [bacterium]|nr:aromatic amino acid lyase [bacterium]